MPLETGRFPGNILFHLNNPYIGIFGRGTMYGKYSLFQIDNNLWLWKQGFPRKLLAFQNNMLIKGFLGGVFMSFTTSIPYFIFFVSFESGFPRNLLDFNINV